MSVVHHDVTGPAGAEVVILHHGLFGTGSTWHDSGVVAALAGTHRVVTLDAAGHGASDDPPVTDCSRSHRVRDVLALADAIGADTFHLVGYSMGAWIAGGTVALAPDRIRSVSMGGWHPSEGPRPQLRFARDTWGLDMTPEVFMAMADATIPELAAAPQARRAAAEATWRAINEFDDDVPVLVAAGIPVHLWAGADEPIHDGMQDVARCHGWRFDSLAGDHLTAMADARVGSMIASFVRSG